MTDDQKTEQQLPRIFEQPPDFVSFYSDLAQVMNTGNEVVLQFYETVPGPPGEEGKVTQVRTRLRATVTVSESHAGNIGRLLLKQFTKESGPAESEPGER